ncbi:TIM barrel protein [Eubacteriales bacterium OttesenSCG-928-N13]|nr:TIM barrel protein [Eubacteriales bacterium OttesenSCG-928-N13]
MNYDACACVRVHWPKRPKGTIRREVDTFGYFHVADVPGRMEPGTGELNYGNILRALAEAKYDGIVGFEFSPSGEDDQVLKDVWARIK